MSTPSRVTAGVPTGGQFATAPRGEADVDLNDPWAAPVATASDPEPVDDRDWGSVANVQVDSRTPWGKADYVSHPADGIVSVGTPGHGGIKLSPERNAEIPAALRNKSGWYEEDCEAAIVGMVHPEAMPHYMNGDMDAIRDASTSTVKSWFPDQYEKATGESVSPEESYVRREDLKRADEKSFRAEHSHEMVSTGWGNDSNGAWVPEGYSTLTAKVDDTGETREYLVPDSDCVSDHMLRKNVVIDPNKHIDVTGISSIGNSPPKQDGPKLTGEAIGVDYSNLPEGKRARARAELDKRWRFPNEDGTHTVESMGEHFERVGLVGKSCHAGDKGTTYLVDYGTGGHVAVLSKSAYDALSGVPDTTTDHARAGIELNNARRRLDRAEGNYESEKAKVARQDVQAAQAASIAAYDAERAKEIPWPDREEMRKTALSNLLAERGIELN